MLVKIVEQPSKTAQPLGHITRVLGEHAAPGMETDIAIHSHGLPFEFPSEVVAEAEAFGGSVSAAAKRGREDLRELPLVTIDGDDARDFDDAVYCEPLRGGSWRLLVAIARRRQLRRAELGAGSRSAAARHVGLLPEPRAADAARGTVERTCARSTRTSTGCAMVCEMRVNARRQGHSRAVLRRP